MKTYTYQWIKKSISATGKATLAVLAMVCATGFSQNLTSEFVTAGYTLTDLGSVDKLPSRYGGLTIRPEQPNTLYICGYANEGAGNLYTVALTRDAVTHHITGFADSAVFYAAAPSNDGGLFFAPNGTLLFTRYSMNHLGQILPNNTYVTTSLSELGIASSVGSVALVPSGYPGAGNLIIASYNAAIFYHVPYTIDGAGLYILANQISEVSVSGIANGPEGMAYIPAGSLAFPQLSMAVSSYGDGTVVVFEVGESGLPLTSTARVMVEGLTGAEGALIDPVTGDFLFSTFGGGDKVIRISGFVVPSAIGDAPAISPGFKIYPNPTDGNLKLEIGKPGSSGIVEIFNIFGQKILEQQYSGEGLLEIDMIGQPTGTYIISVENEHGKWNQVFQKK
jgi:hypothetical protein